MKKTLKTFNKNKIVVDKLTKLLKPNKKNLQ